MDSSRFFDADISYDNIASGYTHNWDSGDHSAEARRNNIYTHPPAAGIIIQQINSYFDRLK